MLDEKDGVWSGPVDVGKLRPGAGGKLSVCAAYDKASDSYNTLLEYEV